MVRFGFLGLKKKKKSRESLERAVLV